MQFKINRPTNIGGLISLHSGEFMDISIFDSIILRKKPFSKILRFFCKLQSLYFMMIMKLHDQFSHGLSKSVNN
ncbi:hypothetical protein C2G38_2079622 [Gigaspora rosea]|uniref:Uncharacterized protein n=1 Tax=Gigaspora rosea TaxID=44941 RepID=A0A397VGD4_9GLOM|nr:hypothetical protein C2G38_2079622 [Gigaspora rosea]